MTDFLLVDHCPDGEDRFLLRSARDAIHRFCDVSTAFSSSEEVITFDLEGILQSCDGVPACNVIDIVSAARLATGVSRPEYVDGSSLDWSFWSLLIHLKLVSPGRTTRLRNEYYGQDRKAASGSRVAVLTEISEVLKRAWQTVLEQLEEAKEVERWENVERPFQRLCMKASLGGIGFDRTGFSEHVRQQVVALYRTRNELQSQWKVYNQRFDPIGVSRALRGSGFSDVQNFDNRSGLSGFIELHRHHSELCEKLYMEAALDRDIQALLRMDVGESSDLRPLYTAIGTVTARVLVLDPPLQSLRKDSRQFLVPRQKKRLLYIDYSQFEATILAHESKDEVLTCDVENENVYAAVADAVFGSPEDRELGKELFYRFCYGAGVESLSDIAASSRKADVRHFFSRYERLKAYREYLSQQLESAGSIRTQLGNHRAFSGKERLRDGRPVWAMSQRIQGTGSLIFKEALLSADSTIPQARLVLPLHDGAVFEIDDDDAKAEDGLRRVFEDTLRRRCFHVPAVAVVKDFWEREMA